MDNKREKLVKRAIIQVVVFMAVFAVIGTIAGYIAIACSLFLTYTKHGKRFAAYASKLFAMWKHYKLSPWFEANKGHWFFKAFENAGWFKWYGKKVVYVQAKDPSKLSATQTDVKDAIVAKDYQKALDIVNSMPDTKKTVMLKQIIEAKLK